MAPPEDGAPPEGRPDGPPPEVRPDGPPTPSRPVVQAPQYGRYVVLLAVVILVLITINTIATKPNGDAGISPGTTVPPFAVPLATGNLQGDADVARSAHEGAAGNIPACKERGKEILNICELYEEGPVVLALFVDGGSCPGVLGDMQALVKAYPQVRFAGVAIKGATKGVRKLIAKMGLSFPVGLDRDGALAALYKLATCPQLSFIERGGSDAERCSAEASFSRGSSCAGRRARCGGRLGMSGGVPAEPVSGWVAPSVAEELPGLQMISCEAQVGREGSLTGASPPDVEGRLRELSNRVRGARAIGIRREPLPAAYRVFFRQVGIDPDVERTPIEAAVLERMLRGGFLTGGMLDDILLIALLDTGVPVWALDSGTLTGPLGIRVSADGEALGRGSDAPLLPAGRLVVADREVALAVLFGERGPAHLPRSGTARLALYSVLVPGVPRLFAEEALWSCANALRGP